MEIFYEEYSSRLISIFLILIKDINAILCLTQSFAIMELQFLLTQRTDLLLTQPSLQTLKMKLMLTIMNLSHNLAYLIITEADRTFLFAFYFDLNLRQCVDQL